MAATMINSNNAGSANGRKRRRNSNTSAFEGVVRRTRMNTSRFSATNFSSQVIVLIVSIALSSILYAEAFGPSSQLIRHAVVSKQNSKFTRLHSTISRQGRGGSGGGSQFGVRKRVRAVLEKAKSRTGVSNVNSESSGPTNPSITPNNEAVYANTNTRRRSASISASFSLNDYDYSYAQSTASTSREYSNSLSSFPSETTSGLKLVEDFSCPSSMSTANDGPLPFTLPELTEEQEMLLASGQRVQEQAAMSLEGSGFVVMDIPAPDYVVWEALLDFEAYPDNIGTVRSMRMFTNTHLKQSYIAEKPIPPGRETRHYGTGSITRASFVLSKFHLNIAAIHKYVPHRDGHYMEFTLDKACKNAVLQDAKGIWYTQSVHNDSTGQTCTRLWLLCELHVSPLLPQFIVDYAARKAMPRATVWIMPTIERLRKEFKLVESSYLA